MLHFGYQFGNFPIQESLLHFFDADIDKNIVYHLLRYSVYVNSAPYFGRLNSYFRGIAGSLGRKAAPNTGDSISSGTLHRRQMNHEWATLPKVKRLLLYPVPALVCDPKVEVEDNTSEDKSHFCIGKAVPECVSAMNLSISAFLQRTFYQGNFAVRSGKVAKLRVYRLRNQGHRGIARGDI